MQQTCYWKEKLLHWIRCNNTVSHWYTLHTPCSKRDLITSSSKAEFSSILGTSGAMRSCAYFFTVNSKWDAQRFRNECLQQQSTCYRTLSSPASLVILSSSENVWRGGKETASADWSEAISGADMDMLLHPARHAPHDRETWGHDRGQRTNSYRRLK